MSIHTAKGAIRTVKNYTKGYSDVQAKVRNATSNDPWGPSGTQMNEIAQATYSHHDFIEVMEMLDKRLNDKGKNWRHVFKALTVLDYCLHAGSENVVLYAKDNIYIVKTLREFQYLDDDGKDVGANVRQKAKDITALLNDEDRLKSERQSRSNMRDRMTGRPGRNENDDEMYNPDGEASYRRPAALEDDRDLQRAIEASKRSAEEEERKKRGVKEDDEELAKALKLSREEDEARKKSEAERQNAALFDSSMDQQIFAPYQQQQQVDFFGNPIYGNQQQLTGFGMQQQPTGYGMQSQQTGFGNNFDANAYQQQLQQQQQQQQWEAQQAEFQRQQQLALQQQQQQQQLMPMQTGSNNPFGQFASQQAQPQQASSPLASQPTGFGTMAQFAASSNGNNAFSSSSSMPSSSAFSTSSSAFSSDLFGSNSITSTANTSPAPKRNAKDEQFAALATALDRREGQDTFGNIGALRVPLGTGFASQRNPALGMQPTGSQQSQPTGNSSFNPSSAFGVIPTPPSNNSSAFGASAFSNGSTPGVSTSLIDLGNDNNSSLNSNPTGSSNNPFAIQTQQNNDPWAVKPKSLNDMMVERQMTGQVGNNAGGLQSQMTGYGGFQAQQQQPQSTGFNPTTAFNGFGQQNGIHQQPQQQNGFGGNAFGGGSSNTQGQYGQQQQQQQQQSGVLF